MTSQPLTVFSKRLAPAENAVCAECGMRVEPATAFHPGLYCWLFKQGVEDPGKFLDGWRFIPDSAYWGEGARNHPRP